MNEPSKETEIEEDDESTEESEEEDEEEEDEEDRREREFEKIAALQPAIVDIVKARFPDLAELAKDQVQLIDSWKTVETILPQIAAPSDKKRVRKILLMLPVCRERWDL